MIRPEDVTDAMVRAVNEVLARPWAYQNDAEAQTKAAIAAAINASGCVLVPREPTEAMAEAAWDAYSPEDSLADMRNAIAAAINASGCVLVPREPTEAMINAGLKAADPREQALDRMAENAQELGLYGKEKGDD